MIYGVLDSREPNGAIGLMHDGSSTSIEESPGLTLQPSRLCNGIWTDVGIT